MKAAAHLVRRGLINEIARLRADNRTARCKIAEISVTHLEDTEDTEIEIQALYERIWRNRKRIHELLRLSPELKNLCRGPSF